MAVSWLTVLRADPCCYCGTRPAGQADHVEPRVDGGQDGPSNRTGICRSCNAFKGRRSPLGVLLARRLDSMIEPLRDQRELAIVVGAEPRATWTWGR